MDTSPLTFIRRAAIGVASCLVLSAYGAATAAAQDCFDFSDPPLGTRYEVGDTIEAANSTIRIREFQASPGGGIEGNQFAVVDNSNIAGGSDRPELRVYLVNVDVTPDQPVQTVTLKFSEPIGNELANLAINNDKLVLQNGLAQADGLFLGNSTAGFAEVRVTLEPIVAGAGSRQGVLELVADSGAIESFSVGGLQTRLDDVCAF